MNNSIRNASKEALEVLGSVVVASDPAQETGVTEIEAGIYRRFRYLPKETGADIGVLFTSRKTAWGNIIDVVHTYESDRSGNPRNRAEFECAIYTASSK